MENMCRTCLRNGDNKLIDLNEDESLISKIEAISSIQITLNEELPSQICEECVENVNKFFCFRKVIINSDKELKEQCEQMKLKQKELEQLQAVGAQTRTKTRKKRIKSEDVIENNENLDDFNHHQDYSDNDIDDDIDDDDVDDPAESKPKIIRKTRSKTKIYKCETCDITFPSRSRLYSHNRGLHTTPAVCNYCGVVVRSDNLKKHMQKHWENPVTCKVCNKVFKNSESLRGHSLLHKGLTFECKLCARTFKIKSEYSRHMKCHVDPNTRKVMCSVCGKRVRDMKKHLLTHTGERPYVCNECNKGFTSTYALKVHSRQHTNEKPFICEYCSMAFPQKVSLVTHLKSKHNCN